MRTKWIKIVPMLWMFAIAGAAAAEKLKTSSEFDKLPLPVQLYVFRLGVEHGLKQPLRIKTDNPELFSIPVAKSDINLDGKTDYYAAACMFAPVEDEAAYQTNGFPCAFAVLMLSNPQGGYETIHTSGTLVNARAGKIPNLLIAQRNFSDCGDDSYMCEAEYEIHETDGNYELVLRKTTPGK